MRAVPFADPGTPDTRSPVRFLLWIARGQWRTLAVGVALVGVLVALQLVDDGDTNPPTKASADVAVEVKGESLGALFDRWLVFYDDIKAPVTTDLIGRLCVVGLADDRVPVKLIKSSRTDGLYHLLSNTEGPIFDVEILWAAKVKTMMPR